MNRHTEVDAGRTRGREGSREDGHADSRCRGEHATAKELEVASSAFAGREDEGGRGRQEQYGFLEFVGVNVQRGRESAGERGGEKGGRWQLVSPCARSCLYVCTRLLARSSACARTNARVRERTSRERERGRERKVIHCSAETNSRARARALSSEVRLRAKRTIVTFMPRDVRGTSGRTI